MRKNIAKRPAKKTRKSGKQIRKRNRSKALVSRIPLPGLPLSDGTPDRLLPLYAGDGLGGSPWEK